jgi:hypothetical protein
MIGYWPSQPCCVPNQARGYEVHTGQDGQRTVGPVDRAAAIVISPHPQPTSSTWSPGEIAAARNRCGVSRCRNAACRSRWAIHRRAVSPFQRCACDAFAVVPIYSSQVCDLSSDTRSLGAECARHSPTRRATSSASSDRPPSDRCASLQPKSSLISAHSPLTLVTVRNRIALSGPEPTVRLWSCRRACSSALAQ